MRIGAVSTGPASTAGRRLAFVAATASFVAVFAASATPIPLYGRFRDGDGLADVDLSVVAVAYFVCAVGSLLVLGRLSDRVGRKPVTLAALALTLVGCVVLATVHSLPPLLIGRALQGVAAGLAASTMGAWAVDTGPSRPAWLVPTVTSSATNVGLPLGALSAGALVDLAPFPRILCFVVVGALLVACAVLVSFAPDSVRRSPGVRAVLRPRITLPPAVRPYLLAASAIFVSTWALGGYYQAFSPSVAEDDLGSRSAFVAAAVFASWVAPSAFGGPIAGRLSDVVAQRVGASVVAVAALGLVGSTLAGSAPLFIVAGLVGGVGMGIGMTASIRSLLAESLPSERAGVLSLIYAISYTGAAVPGLIAGQLSRAVPLIAITAGYAGLAVIALAVVLLAARSHRTGRLPVAAASST